MFVSLARAHAGNACPHDQVSNGCLVEHATAEVRHHAGRALVAYLDLNLEADGSGQVSIGKLDDAELVLVTQRPCGNIVRGGGVRFAATGQRGSTRGFRRAPTIELTARLIFELRTPLVLAEVSIKTTTSFGPVAAAMYQGRTRGSYMPQVTSRGRALPG